VFSSEGQWQATWLGVSTNQIRSLPSGIEQPELARMLSEHLSEYAEVKNVKVVRDSKGGVCAFVQCEVLSHFLYLVELSNVISTRFPSGLSIFDNRTRLQLPVSFTPSTLKNRDLSWDVSYGMNPQEPLGPC
jgi:hypothetical protein